MDAVAEWLRKQQERLPVLSRLLTLLDDPHGRRVTIVATGPDEAMKWIAAATLLMPMRQALTISFKVFSANPGRAPQRIIAVPRELHPQLAPERGESSFVLDADECTADPIEVSERASFLTGQFASVDDPYDVIDAVELAESLGDDHPDGRREALLTAWALTRPDEPPSDPGALFGWLSQAGAALLAEHGAAVASMILGATPSARQLRWIDQAITQRLIGLDAESVRVQLLAAELAEARSGTAPLPEQLSRVEFNPEAQRDADSELSSAILLSPSPQVDLLLRLTRRHRIDLQLSSPLRQRVEEFVSDWIDHDRRYDPRRWALSSVVLDVACDQLRDRLTPPVPRSTFSALQRLYPYLIDRIGDASDPLSRHLGVAAITALPEPDRPARVKVLVQQILKSAAPDPALDDLQGALLQWNAAGPHEVVALLEVLPDSAGIRPEIARVAVARLEKAADKPSRRMLKVLAALDKRRLAPESGPLTGVLAADRNVDAFIEGTRSHHIIEKKYFRATMDCLYRAVDTDPAVVDGRLPDVLEAAVACRHPEVGGAVVATLPSPLGRRLIDQWATELGGSQPVATALWGIDCATYPDLPPRRYSQIRSAVSEYAATLPDSDYERWSRDVLRDCQPHQAQILREFIEYQPPRTKPRRNLWTRRDGG